MSNACPRWVEICEECLLVQCVQEANLVPLTLTAVRSLLICVAARRPETYATGSFLLISAGRLWTFEEGQEEGQEEGRRLTTAMTPLQIREDRPWEIIEGERVILEGLLRACKVALLGGSVPQWGQGQDLGLQTCGPVILVLRCPTFKVHRETDRGHEKRAVVGRHRNKEMLEM